MRVIIKHKKFRFVIWVHLRLLLTLVLPRLLKELEKKDIEIDPKVFKKEALAAIKSYKRKCGAFKLLQIDSADGNGVSIKV